jgi:nucleoside-diphosphate-sugar epimerase
MDSMLNNVAQLNLTKGEQQRDFIYINEVVTAYQTIIEYVKELKDNFIEIDVGTGTTISIHKLVIKLKELTHNTVTKLNFGALPYRENELMESKADIHLLMQLGWSPKINIDAGLKECLQEYKL